MPTIDSVELLAPFTRSTELLAPITTGLELVSRPQLSVEADSPMTTTLALESTWSLEDTDG